mmetsp:Transcript_17784/g.42981  ORF Transcript_17784/g.42981 Transcript_17784/m.42981 type:complete len:371 (-) Transcript_17784:411-1523(-)
MYNARILKSFKISESTIWSIEWSNAGNFLFSSGSNGIISIWGPVLKTSHQTKNFKSNYDQKFFNGWKLLGKFNTLLINKTFRSIGISKNVNNLSVSNFSGELLLCNLENYISKKIFSIKITSRLIGHSAEIKNSSFSLDGGLLSTCGRDKTILIWEKNHLRNFQCLFVIDNHESDIKRIIWHQSKEYIFSSTYNGFIRAIGVYSNEWRNCLKFTFDSSIIWSIDLNSQGEFILVLTEDASFFFCPIFRLSQIKTYILQNMKKFSIILFENESFVTFKFSLINATLIFGSTTGALNILKKQKNFSSFSKNNIRYGKILQDKNFYWLKNEIFLPNSSPESILSVIWHPLNENILASTGKNSKILIWFFGSYV